MGEMLQKGQDDKKIFGVNTRGKTIPTEFLERGDPGPAPY